MDLSTASAESIEGYGKSQTKSVRYTEQQIEDFCKTAVHTAQYNRMPTLVTALQIIRQLQARTDLRHLTVYGKGGY